MKPFTGLRISRGLTLRFRHVPYNRAFNSGGVSFQAVPPAQRLTNSLTREKEDLKMVNPPVLRWYSCGPTVYDTAHLGHAYSYMQFDLIRRVLENFCGINVVQVMNVTDIDDKIIAKANQTNANWTDIARRYEMEFFEDMRSLGLKAPTITARISDFMPQTIQFVERLLSSGLAYVAPSGSVYFDKGKFGRGLKFRPPLEDMPFDKMEKKAAADFAVWKGGKPGEPSWHVPFSAIPGRPGWHIECSTVATHFFGSSVDLHSGGKDLMFPHHENEETQCCAYHGVDSWAQQWIHTGHILASDSRKMSKSEKNYISIRDYLEKFTADQFRMFCMRQHYKSGCIYDEEKMRYSADTVSRFSNFSNMVDAYVRGVIPESATFINEPEIYEKIHTTASSINSALADDFNFPLAIDALTELVSTCHKMLTPGGVKSRTTSAGSFTAMVAAANLTESFFEKCGLTLPTQRNMAGNLVGNGSTREVKIFPAVMDAVTEFRSGVRQAALTALKTREAPPDFSKSVLRSCDEFRVRLANSGISLKDVGTGAIWSVDEVGREMAQKKS